MRVPRSEPEAVLYTLGKVVDTGFSINKNLTQDRSSGHSVWTPVLHQLPETDMAASHIGLSGFPAHLPLRSLLVASLLTLAAAGCGGKPPASSAPASAPQADTEATAPETAPTTLAATDTTWTPEALEELLAPIALYPDVVLGQVLVAATNPQEVLDAGNWLLQNQTLKGKALDESAKTVGFTTPVRGLLQAPEVVDMLCMQMDWTTELGQAFVNDQAGVLDAVQRLRAQAKDVGNLASSDKLAVETEQQDGKEVITVASPTPQVVYVPQYNPVAVYAPAPAPATSTTTVVTEKEGHSTGALVTTGLLSFGAGLLVAEIFDDDDDDYYPRYYGPPMPYYPPYPYRPRYGNGYYPNSGYNRPPNYNSGFNNNTIIVNNGNGGGNNYWDRYDGKPGNDRGSRTPKSPITAAKQNRPEINSLNARSKDQPKRIAPAQSEAWKGKSSYSGATAGNREAAARVAAQPKVQGSYAGGKASGPSAAATAAASKQRAVKNAAPGVQRPTARPATRPSASTTRSAATDRGRPAAAARAPDRSNVSAVSGSTRGGAADRAASQRGRESMPKGVPPKARSSGKSAPRKARR